MKIVLSSALYPPDVAPSATYIKELARRLAFAHDVTAVVYGYLPEEVPGARIVAVDKRRALPLRVIAYFLALSRAARGADALFVENGASVELPALLLTFLGRSVLLHIGDTAAAAQGGIAGAIHYALTRRARVIRNTPPQKPEILPFSARPDTEIEAWEREWQNHVQELEQAFSYAG